MGRKQFCLFFNAKFYSEIRHIFGWIIGSYFKLKPVRILWLLESPTDPWLLTFRFSVEWHCCGRVFRFQQDDATCQTAHYSLDLGPNDLFLFGYINSKSNEIKKTLLDKSEWKIFSGVIRIWVSSLTSEMYPRIIAKLPKMGGHW